MLGFGALSEAPLSALPQDGVAVFTMTGAGTFAAVGSSVAASVFSISGAGTASFVGSARSAAVLSATGISTVTWTGLSFGSAAFSFTGVGSLFAYSIPRTPASRTATVPLKSRSLLLQRESRLQPVPVYGERSATVITLSRTLMVPQFPRISVSPQVQG